MNTKQFKALATATKSEVINGVVNEILDTIKQGGITKISEVRLDVNLMIKDLFGDANKVALTREIMAEIDKKLILDLA
jgi:hypothetical protein